jgi:hypothetical protein
MALLNSVLPAAVMPSGYLRQIRNLASRDKDNAIIRGSVQCVCCC